MILTLCVDTRYLLNKSGEMLSQTNFLDSRFRGNDRYLLHFVIPAKAGIQDTCPHLLRCYDISLN